MDAYARLQLLLDSHPAGAPASKILDDILHLLFTPEEAAVAGAMGFSLRGAAQVAAVCGLPPADVERHLESMTAKGVVFSRDKEGERAYALLPTIPGVYEFPFMAPVDLPERQRLGELWHQYHREALGAAFAGEPTPLSRVIPIQQAIDTRTEVLPFDALPVMLERNQSFAVGSCACRLSVAACDQPLEVCLFFDHMATFLVERGFARSVSRSEALAIARGAAQSGLVHTTNNSRDRLTFVCNCCPCCCTILRGITELDHPHAVAVSRWQPRISAGTCTACGACGDGCCPVGAMKAHGETAVVDLSRCIGCGLCRAACEAEAIVMEPRPDVPETPATVAELLGTVAAEKGKLEAFLRLSGR